MGFISKTKHLLYLPKCEIIGRFKKLHEEPVNYPIDFVVSWVDGSDKEWQDEKKKYSINQEEEDNGEARYRDWDQLKYWFRAVEKYAPWVRKIHFVTYGHLPKWLNTNHEKINIVAHEDYIPGKYLPTFNSSVIELVFDRIQGLSEHFVYFNDDMYLNKAAKKEDFFSGEYPKYCSEITPFRTFGKAEPFHHKFLNIIALINWRFDINKSMQKYPELWFNKCYKKNYKHHRRAYRENYLSGIDYTHLGMPLRKSTITKVWDNFEEALETTCINRFRSSQDVHQQIFHLWDMLSGEYYPVSNNHFGKLFKDLENEIDEAEEYMLKEKGIMVCLNDTEYISDSEFKNLKNRIDKVFEQKFPEKSSFEI